MPTQTPSAPCTIGIAMPNATRNGPTAFRSRSRRAAVMPMSSRNSTSAPWKPATKNGATVAVPSSPATQPMPMPPTKSTMLRPVTTSRSASCHDPARSPRA